MTHPARGLDNPALRPETVGILGLGYVGLPLCLAFAEQGITVFGVDTDSAKIDLLSDGGSYIKHVPANRVPAVVRNGRFSVCTDMGTLAGVEAILICVPTPLTVNRTPDLTCVESTAFALAKHLQHGQLVDLEATTYPGTTDGVLRSVLEKVNGLVAGNDFHPAFSPEREDPGNPTKLRDISKVVGGLTTECLDRTICLYSKIVRRVVPVKSCRVAETTKLLENIFRSVNIALVNELKVIYAIMGAGRRLSTACEPG